MPGKNKYSGGNSQDRSGSGGKKQRDRRIKSAAGKQNKQYRRDGRGSRRAGQILDTDAIIQEERKNLARLQEECRDKLRQAEVEISLERAKIARDRSQLDEKLHVLEQQGIDLTTVNEKKEPAKPPRGRWLARLGLTGSEDEMENKS